MQASVADPDPVSGAFLTPGSGIRVGEKSGIGHPVPGPYFRELSNIRVQRGLEGAAWLSW